MKLRFLVFTFSFLVLFASCEKALMPQEAPDSPTAVFDHLWQQVDTRYSLFDVKGVDWQQVYDTLRTKVSDDISDDSLFSLCAAMLSTLRDGHVNLYNDNDISHSDSIIYHFYHDSQIDIDAIVLGYLGTNYHSTGGIAHQALDGGRVAYLRYGSFSSTITVSQLRHILRSYPDAQGLILDIRGNGGGAITNIHNLLSILPSHGQHLYSSQIKAGPAHDQFTPLTPSYAPEVDDSNAFQGPVVVLIDRGCYSASSLFALCCQAYPSVILVGDTTGGGLGLPATFLLPNGWRYRISVTRLLSPQGQNFENGVPPHHLVHLDRQAALTRYKDNIIDTAITIINTLTH